MFDRSISLGQLILAIIAIEITVCTGIIWANNQITLHGYRLDKVEAVQSNGNKEIISKMDEFLRNQQISNKQIALIEQHSGYQDDRINTILSRIDNYTRKEK